MKKYSGDATLKGNLDVLSDKPLDSRLVVQNKEDLYTLDSRYVYNGMPVVCIEENCIYILKDKTQVQFQDGWAKVNAGSNPNSPNIVVLEENEYKRLQEIDSDTLYFIYEPWEFGSSFPVYFQGWRFGDAFPIKLL